MRSNIVRCAGSIGACLALAAPVLAQRAPPDKETAHSLALLRDRSRVALHDGDPLTIVGLEQGDNEIRSASPALLNAAHASALVDPTEAYARALAMYDEGATFHGPPAPYLEAEPAVDVEAPERAPAPARVEAGMSVPGKVWVPLLVALVLLVGLGLRRRLRVVLRLRRADT